MANDAEKSTIVAQNQTLGSANTLSLISTIVGIVAIVVGLVAAFFIRGSIMNPINRVIAGLRCEGGDSEHRVAASMASLRPSPAVSPE